MGIPEIKIWEIDIQDIEVWENDIRDIDIQKIGIREIDVRDIKIGDIEFVILIGYHRYPQFFGAIKSPIYNRLVHPLIVGIAIIIEEMPRLYGD